MLHIKSKDKATPKEESSDDGEKQSLVSGFVDTANTVCSETGTVDTASILAIVLVQAKAKKGNKVVTAYVFLDPGSTVYL